VTTPPPPLPSSWPDDSRGLLRHHDAVTDRIVVVGGGIATVRLVETLRRLGNGAEIVVIAGEPHEPYDRPPLSKAVMQGDDGEPPYLRSASDYVGWNVDLRLGRRAVAVRADAATIDLDDGTQLSYDALVVATGAEPRRLADVSGPGVHLLRTFDDAIRLRAAMRSAGRLVVIGAGFIGCEVAASARATGIEVTLVDVLSAPLVRVLGEQVAAEVTRMHKDAGVDLRMQSTLPDHPDLVDAPATLVAIGVAPTTGWLEGSGIAVDDGVRCDASGQTNAPRVWAMGDVATWRDAVTGRSRRSEHWTTAGDQAVVVARNLAGGGEAAHTLSEVPYFWSDQYGVKLQSLGTPAPDDDVELLTVGPHKRPLALYGSAGVLTGVVGFGVPRQVMRMRRVLASQGTLEAAVAVAADEAD
jgi:3-phenylpropionate/trans-cinnamate dioxygenase ferredoxin reductase component